MEKEAADTVAANNSICLLPSGEANILLGKLEPGWFTLFATTFGGEKIKKKREEEDGNKHSKKKK